MSVGTLSDLERLERDLQGQIAGLMDELEAVQKTLAIFRKKRGALPEGVVEVASNEVVPYRKAIIGVLWEKGEREDNARSSTEITDILRSRGMGKDKDARAMQSAIHKTCERMVKRWKELLSNAETGAKPILFWLNQKNPTLY